MVRGVVTFAVLIVLVTIVVVCPLASGEEERYTLLGLWPEGVHYSETYWRDLRILMLENTTFDLC